MEFSSNVECGFKGSLICAEMGWNNLKSQGKAPKGVKYKEGFKRLCFSTNSYSDNPYIRYIRYNPYITVSIEKCKNETRSRFQLTLSLWESILTIAAVFWGD